MKSTILALVIGGAAVLSACGGDGESTPTGVTTITVGPAAYATIPPVASTIPPTTLGFDAPGTLLEFESTYVIAAGDYPSTIANAWGVPFEELMALNGWTLDPSGIVPEWPGVGATIKIPAGATVPGSPVGLPATSAPPSAGAESTATTTGPTSPPTTAGSNCTPGEYTIEATDTTRQKVADKFDVTVAALDAANANTNGYSSFYPGLKIVIPC
jgi:LysM repeat protein